MKPTQHEPAYAPLDTPWEMSAQAREHAEHIARNIDREAFPRVAPEDVPTHPDAVIISQALAAGETIVLTGNMNSVKHDIVNRWIQTRGREHGVRPAQILHAQDALMPRLFYNASSTSPARDRIRRRSDHGFRPFLMRGLRSSSVRETPQR